MVRAKGNPKGGAKRGVKGVVSGIMNGYWRSIVVHVQTTIGGGECVVKAGYKRGAREGGKSAQHRVYSNA